MMALRECEKEYAGHGLGLRMAIRRTSIKVVEQYTVQREDRIGNAA